MTQKKLAEEKKNSKLFEKSNTHTHTQKKIMNELT